MLLLCKFYQPEAKQWRPCDIERLDKIGNERLYIAFIPFRINGFKLNLFMHYLHRLSLFHIKRGSQHLMPFNNVFDCFAKFCKFYLSLYQCNNRNIIRHADIPHLIKNIEPALWWRGRVIRSLTALFNFRISLLFAVIHNGSKFFDGGIFKNTKQRNLNTFFFLQMRLNNCSFQWMSAQFKEIISNTYLLHPQNIFPEFV